MDDLLKEAIADAKAVRETALENAKIALEEAFTPRLQSMLSKKIQSEIEVEEGEHEDDEDVEEARHDDEEEVDEKMRLKADDEDPTDDASEGARMEDDEDDVEEAMHDEDEDDVEEGMHDEEEDDDPAEGRMKDEDEDDDVDEELDLESVLKELEADLDEDVEEGMHDEEEDEEEKVDENDVSSGIGAADNKLDKKAGDTTGIGDADKAKFTESAEELDEDIDLDEVLKALSEEEDEDEEKNEVSKLQSELDEHREVVKYLRGKLNEVNLLNAKLLFTNKLFRAYGLSNDQKMKVVETFDRATNLREVKLVYSTLVESFKTNQPEKIKESKGSASKPVASTKSEKQEILSEGSELRDRFKKLAGITKFNS